jgi:hypothetical protein
VIFGLHAAWNRSILYGTAPLLRYRGFQTHLMASCEQAITQGESPFSGLHEEHVYFIFFRCCSVTAATVLSSRSISSVVISKAF